MERKAKIFSGTGSGYLAEKITRQFGNHPGKITIQHFSDGEIQPIFQESIRGDMVFLVQSRKNNKRYQIKRKKSKNR